VRASILTENESTLDTPIDKAILTDPANPLVVLILYIYSMETFIFPVIMRASGTGDKSKVNNLGPYTLVLSEII
jgi:O-antigen/teichoic acid export membrane protein